MEDNNVNKAFTGLDIGVGVRVVKGDQTGFSFSEDLSLRAITDAAKVAANIADSSINTFKSDMSVIKFKNLYPIPSDWEDTSVKGKMPYLTKINNRVFSIDSRIIKSNIWFADEISKVMIASSDGKISYDIRPMTTVSVS